MGLAAVVVADGRAEAELVGAAAREVAKVEARQQVAAVVATPEDKAGSEVEGNKVEEVTGVEERAIAREAGEVEVDSEGVEEDLGSIGDGDGAVGMLARVVRARPTGLALQRVTRRRPAVIPRRIPCVAIAMTGKR